MKHSHWVLALALIAGFWAMPVHAQRLFVQSAKAPLWAEPAFQAARIGELSKGDAVETLSEKSGWLKIASGDQQGWMLKLMLGAHPPMETITANPQAMDELALRARRRPSSFATTAAARGLRERLNQTGAAAGLDYQALEKMERWRASEKDALNFLQKVQAHDPQP